MIISIFSSVIHVTPGGRRLAVTFPNLPWTLRRSDGEDVTNKLIVPYGYDATHLPVNSPAQLGRTWEFTIHDERGYEEGLVALTASWNINAPEPMTWATGIWVASVCIQGDSHALNVYMPEYEWPINETTPERPVAARFEREEVL